MKRVFGLSLAAFAIAGAVLFSSVTAPVALAADDNLTAKLQDLVSKLSPEQQAALYTLLTSANGAAAGAAAAAPSPDSAKETFLKGVAGIKEIAKKGDINAMMALISEDFEHPQVGGKAELKEFLQGAIDMGYLEMYADDTEIKTNDTEIKVDGDKATFYPIEVEGPWGSATLEFTAKLENGVWKIISADVSGV
jgi:ketosteroid isomerase-like protein